jgi:hypothetical protein
MSGHGHGERPPLGVDFELVVGENAMEVTRDEVRYHVVELLQRAARAG